MEVMEAPEVIALRLERKSGVNAAFASTVPAQDVKAGSNVNNNKGKNMQSKGEKLKARGGKSVLEKSRACGVALTLRDGNKKKVVATVIVAALVAVMIVTMITSTHQKKAKGICGTEVP